MASNTKLKRAARARQARTGERYTDALARVKLELSMSEEQVETLIRENQYRGLGTAVLKPGEKVTLTHHISGEPSVIEFQVKTVVYDTGDFDGTHPIVVQAIRVDGKPVSVPDGQVNGHINVGQRMFRFPESGQHPRAAALRMCASFEIDLINNGVHEQTLVCAIIGDEVHSTDSGVSVGRQDAFAAYQQRAAAAHKGGLWSAGDWVHTNGTEMRVTSCDWISDGLHGEVYWLGYNPQTGEIEPLGDGAGSLTGWTKVEAFKRDFDIDTLAASLPVEEIIVQTPYIATHPMWVSAVHMDDGAHVTHILCAGFPIECVGWGATPERPYMFSELPTPRLVLPGQAITVSSVEKSGRKVRRLQRIHLHAQHVRDPHALQRILEHHLMILKLRDSKAGSPLSPIESTPKDA